MVRIQLKNQVKLPVEKSILIQAAQQTLKFADAAYMLDLTIVIGKDALLRALNLKYRQVDFSTDVLAFPSGEIDPDTSGLYLGDIVISFQHAQDQASAGAHAIADELQLLVVHGTLHLLGYDHATVNDKKRMQLAQDTILKSLGLNLVMTL